MSHNNIYQGICRQIQKRFSIQCFEKYILNSRQNIKDLTKMIKYCNVDDINCRFNVWRLCLGVISTDVTIDHKKEQLDSSRNSYLQKKQQTVKGYKKSSPIKQQKKNPLMMGNTKSQTKHTESDEFLKQQIQKDVQRTYQQMPFFQNKDISKLLNLVLFVWCKRNPQVSYKQGINQLLASVVVCYFQQVEFRKLQDKPDNISNQLWKTHLFFNSVEYAEADIYNLFEKIINIQGDMYKTQADQCIKSKVNPNSKNNTPILQRIMHIKDHKLKHMDMELFRIIKLQDVQTKSFMLRWIRCMHTREFSLENSFVIWDSIFLEYLQSPQSKKKGQFQFIDAMCLAMFIYMRSIVLKKETAGQILSVYQKYPVLKRGDYLDELIALAWTVCEELRLENINTQNQNQNNEFDVNDKLKDMKFLNKAVQPKVQVQNKINTMQIKKVQNKNTTQLKRPQHKKQIQELFVTKQKKQQKPSLNNKGVDQVNKFSQVSSKIVKVEQASVHIDSTQKSSYKALTKQRKYNQSQNIQISKVQINSMIVSLRQTCDLLRDGNLFDTGNTIRKVIKQLQNKLQSC